MPLTPDDLTRDELRRLVATVQRRLGGHPDVKAVGIGSAMKDGKPDPKRPLVARVWVKLKRERVSEHRQIPRSISVRLRRGAGYETIEVPVDITETKDIEVTARIEPGEVTTSAIVRWSGDDLDQPAYGFITCAHGFGGRSTCRDGPSASCEVRVVSETGARALAWVRWKSTASQGIDAAICACEREELRAWLGTDLPTTQHKIAPTEDLPLLAAFKTRGHTLSTPQRTPLRLLSYTPGPIDLDREEKLPPLRHVLEAEADANHTFREGTSGSLWEADGQLVAMQSAGLRPNFERGYAVGLQSAVGRAFVDLGARSLVVLDRPT